MTRTIRPLSDRVVLRRVDAPIEAAAGILMPEIAIDKPQVADVVAVGPGWRDKRGRLKPMTVAAGDRVVFAKYTIGEMKLDGEELVIVREHEILCVIGRRAT